MTSFLKVREKGGVEILTKDMGGMTSWGIYNIYYYI